MTSGRAGRADIRDVRGLTQRLDDQRLAIRELTEADIVFDEGRKLKLRSANGIYWSIQVSDLGVLSTTDEGTTLP